MQSNHVVISTAINTSLFDSTCVLGSAGLQVFMLLTGSVPIAREKNCLNRIFWFLAFGLLCVHEISEPAAILVFAEVVLLWIITNQLLHFTRSLKLLFRIPFLFSNIKIWINQCRDQICMLNGASCQKQINVCLPQSVIRNKIPSGKGKDYWKNCKQRIHSITSENLDLFYTVKPGHWCKKIFLGTNNQFSRKKNREGRRTLSPYTPPTSSPGLVTSIAY